MPAMVETLPASWIAVKCPLCSEYRRFLPTEVFPGRVSYALVRKPVRSARGGQGKPCSTPNAHLPRPNRTLIYMGACM